MADGIFVDFIPEGQETGALSGSGYKDFVPAPEPEPTPEKAVDSEQSETTKVVPKKANKKK